MKSTVSLILALFLLFSTVGMAKTTHWCMGHAMDSAIGFGEKHLDCGMELPADQENEATPEDPSSCCENKTQHLQVDDDFQVSQLDFQPTLRLPSPLSKFLYLDSIFSRLAHSIFLLNLPQIPPNGTFNSSTKPS